MRLATRRSNSRPSQEEEDAKGEQTSREYHECVEEIKRENKILGSLEFHHETMRRLKQKQGAKLPQDDDMRSAPKGIRSFARSLVIGHDIARSLQDMGRKVSAHRKSSAGSIDPSTEVIPGRRESTVVAGFDEGIISSQILQDLELSDSDDSEWDESCSTSLSQLLGENDNGGRRASLIRRMSSRSSIRRSSSKIKMPNAIGRYSKRRPSTSSVSFGTNSSPNENKEGDEIVAPEEDKSNGEEGEVPESGNNRKDEELGTTGEGRESDRGQSSTIRSRRTHVRRGKRRSSLFSVDEQRASIVGRSSFTSSSEESAKGGSSEAGDGSLICNFRHRNSLNSSLGSDSAASIQEDLLNEGEDKPCDLHRSNRTLICGWDPQQSSEADLLKEGGKPSSSFPNRSNRSLICDWDPQQSYLSNSVVSILGDLPDEDEKILKEACSLFDVRNSQVV
mmetsp:Transcript_30822/g.53573  ORF Transcript_30822/g.53573 Transcript_30822/m.53573 type:complete len:449 (+) Transcript_30822:94-1440(+)